MAKRKKSRRLRPADSNNTPHQSEPIARMESTPITQQEPRSRVRKTASKFGDWALKKALDFLLVGVLAVITAPSIAIWVYFRSGRASWTYPWLYAALGFIAACVVIIFMASLLSLIKARRKRATERAINLEFLSKDKGYLDHALNQAKAFKAFNSLISGIVEAMGDIAKTNTRATAQIKLAERVIGARPHLLAFFGHKIASHTAKKLNKHAAEMQSHLSKLQEVSTLLVESITGYTSWFPVSSDEQAQVLINDKTSIENLSAITTSSIQSTKFFRDSQQGLYGISQELNTATNRMVSVTDGLIDFLQNSTSRWSEVITLLNNKLEQYYAAK